MTHWNDTRNEKRFVNQNATPTWSTGTELGYLRAKTFDVNLISDMTARNSLLRCLSCKPRFPLTSNWILIIIFWLCGSPSKFHLVFKNQSYTDAVTYQTLLLPFYKVPSFFNGFCKSGIFTSLEIKHWRIPLQRMRWVSISGWEFAVCIFNAPILSFSFFFFFHYFFPPMSVGVIFFFCIIFKMYCFCCKVFGHLTAGWDSTPNFQETPWMSILKPWKCQISNSRTPPTSSDG